MATIPPPSPIAAAFDTARKDFLRDVPPEDVEVISKSTSIDDVYNATDEIQKKQAETRTLQNLSKIQPYLECLTQYSGVLDTIVQVKPDVLAVIWAPLKMLLIVSSTYMKSYTKVLDSMAQIGAALPQFKAYAQLFAQSHSVRRVLELFFRDILDFHLTALKFFRLKHWRVLFESLWPKYSSKFTVILNSIMYHRNLMDGEVTLAHITEAHAARVAAYERYEKDKELNESLEFQSIMASVSPHLHDSRLERIKQRCSIQAGRWLEKDSRFLEWQDHSKQSSKVLWLRGIPGAGKTFLSSIIVNKLQGNPSQHPVVFAFLSHQSYQTNVLLTTLHSFLFQLVIDDKTLRPVLSDNNENNYRKLRSSPDFVRDLLKDILVVSPTAYIVVDGLDEITETERSTLLASLLLLQKQCPTLKLLISSRAEYDISRDLGSKCEIFHVHESNTQDIADYVETRVDAWLCELDLDPGFISEIRRLTKEIASKSKGMFLYARLICDGLESLSDMDDVYNEVQNLPQGLSEAYGRILERINRGLNSSERAQAKGILEWVSCSIYPVTQNEIRLALSIANGKDPFQGRRESLLDVVRRCGPIIEAVNDYISFVHFSAKEFLFSSESGHYINQSEANMAIASTCLKYLCSDCFEPALSDQDIIGGIMRGAYVLQEYTISHWLEHVIRGLSDCKKNLSLEQVSGDIEAMIELRGNNDFERTNTGYVAHPSLNMFEAKTPEVFKALIPIHSFLQKRWNECSLADGAIDLAANRSESVSNLQQIELGMFGFMSGHISAIDLSHHQGEKQTIVAEQNSGNNHGDLKNFLLDAVENSDTVAISENISEVPRFAEELILKAGKSGSGQMLELLLDNCPVFSTMQRSDILAEIIYGSHVETAQILLDRGFLLDDIFKYGLRNAFSLDMLQLILPRGQKAKNFHYYCLINIAFLPSARDPEIEAKATKCLGLLQHGTYSEGELADVFKSNAVRSCSVALAKILLQSGVDVNYLGRHPTSHSNTALYIASGRRGQRAAELMRFLLESGADPSLKGKKGNAIADKPGPRNIKKWFGISWDQLVEESAKKYAASLASADEKEYGIQDDDDANRDGESNNSVSSSAFILSESDRDSFIAQLDTEDNVSISSFNWKRILN